jgi:DNA excision repair protein ERCC-2
LTGYTIAVRAMCEFTAKQGDLDLRFTPSPTALEGIAGHAVVASRRGEHYRSEVTLEGDYGLLHVRGRADGYDPDQNLIEEVKTYRGQFSSIPDNHRHLHWAQLRIYGHLMCEQLDVQEVNLALVYFDIGTQQETLLRETRSRAELKAIFEDHCGRFIAWAEQEMRHRERRNDAWARCASRTRISVRASASSPRPCSAPTPASAACWPRRRPASARPSAPCSRP